MIANCKQDMHFLFYSYFVLSIAEIVVVSFASLHRKYAQEVPQQNNAVQTLTYFVI